MAMEPITIYSRRIDPRGVAELLRELDPEVQIVGPDDAWETATLHVRQPGHKEPLRLILSHDPGYYDGEDWSRQMLGMQGYFQRFPDNPRKRMALSLIGSFRFALATIWAPDLIAEGDARLPYLFAVVVRLDGALFTPSSLRDAEGRILYAADGDYDEDAVFPTIPTPAPVPDLTEPDEPADEETPPPTAQRAARRALGLLAVTVRALLEQDDPSDPASQDLRERILNWVEAIGIGDEIEPDEWEVLQRPLGRLDGRQQIDATWRLEGLVVLAWALGKFELPPHDTLVNPNELAQALPFLDDEASREWLEQAELVSPEQLEWQSKRLLGLHWRLVDFTVRPQAMDFLAFSQKCWFGSFDISGIELFDNDLGLRGQPVAKADEEAFGTALSAARERHLAINWLQGRSRLYSRTDTST